MSLINIERTIDLDIYDHDTTPSAIKAIQMDAGTRTVFAVIRNSGQTYDIGQNASLSLTVLRPDKTKVQITGEPYRIAETTADGETITYYGVSAELTQLALAVKGNLKAQFKITSGEQELRTEIFTINTGEALDAGDGDWAGDLDGHNLDEMAQDIEDTKAAVSEMETDVSDLKEGLSEVESDVFDISSISILDNASLTSKNTDIQISANSGDVLKVSIIPNGKRVTVALCKGTSFVDDPTQYVVVSNSSEVVSNLEYLVTEEYKCLHLYASSITEPVAVITAQIIHRKSKIATIEDDVSGLREVVYDKTVLTQKNTDKVATVRAGDEVVISCITNGNTVSFSLNEGTSYVSDPTKNRVMSQNSVYNLDEYIYTVESGTWESIHIWNNRKNDNGIIVSIRVIRKIPVVDDTSSISGEAADAKIFGDAMKSISAVLTEEKEYKIAEDRSLTSKNTDIVCDFVSGDSLKVTCDPSGQSLTLALCLGTSFVDDPTQYIVLYSGKDALSDQVFNVDGTYKCLHIWRSTATAITLTATRIRKQNVTDGLRDDVDSLIKTKKKHFACFGDSITSEQVIGVGTAVSNLLDCDQTGNFACGYAVCSDWHNGSTVTTPISLTEPQNTHTADNVLSNQILRCLQYTTAEGEQITWTHPIAGAQSIDTTYGVGLGHTDKKPDILYIAIGINDGNDSQNAFTDDAETVMGTAYANLTKCSMASALRWAIETLQSAYPDAQVFVASPLFTTSNDASNNGQKSRGAVLAKRECIKKIANYCNATFIDSTFESGYTVMAANSVGDLHPNARYKSVIARYVANQIRERLCIA